MKREEAEKLIAATLNNQDNEYSLYANNLRGGIVEYTQGSCVLAVTYAAGSPAPRVLNQQNKAVHYLPIDETVITFRVYKNRMN
jgi:hypothetical protein